MPSLVQAGLSTDANLQGYWKLNQSEDTNTKLLLHFNGADAATSTLESSAGRTVTFAGNAQIDTAKSKFGSGSLLLDGTGDYVSLADSADWSFGTGDFTIDAWVWFNATGNFKTLCGQYQSNTLQWRILFGSTATAFYVDNTTTTIGIVNSWTPSTGQWYHFALTRSGTTFRMFVDGTQIGTDQTDADTIPDFTGSLYIGTDFNGSSGSSNNFNGWIDELRIVKGTAKWTANFTPPTQPYSFLVDDSSNNGYHLITGTRPTSVTGLYDQAGDFESGSSNYIALASASCPNLNITGSRTVSVWYKPETSGASMRVIGKDDSVTGYFIFLTSPTKAPSFVVRGLTTNVQVSSSTAVTDGSWNHICAVYDSSNSLLKIFHNGTKAQVTASGSSTSSSVIFTIGSDSTPSNYIDGILDDVAVFNRALTDSEVMRIYTSFVPKVIFI